MSGMAGFERVSMIRRDPVVIAWALGLGLAALVFWVGPDRFLFRLEDTLHVLAWRLGEAIADLSATALDAVRALAIGLYVTFLGLGFAVLRRGGRARGAMVVVTLLFLLMAGGASPGDQVRWVAALVLSGIGASVMTGRLRQTGVALRH
jgi:hypothetical protein